MKICIAQLRPVKGDIETNITNHKKLIALAISYQAEVIVFPELSITGYEPKLAKKLATDQGDSRFDDFQKLSDANGVTIGIGVPTKTNAGIYISMVLFQSHKERRTYSKKYIHADEKPFFCSGPNFAIMPVDGTQIALAICYELSITEHAEDAFKNGAEIYVASVAKPADGVKKASERLSHIAANYSMTVLMSNCVGFCEDFEGAGGSAVWNKEGIVLSQLDKKSEGIVIFDTVTQESFKKIYSSRNFRYVL